MELSFCRRLPKIELHAHLNGSLSQKTLQELYQFYKLSSSEVSDLDISVFSKGSYSLPEFFQIFNITYKLTSTPESVQMATESVIEDFSNDNVIYLELRSTLRKENKMSKREYLAAMIRGVLKCRIACPNITVKLIISINRGEPVESAEENISLSIEFFKKHPDIIVGIDTSGNPTKSNFRDYIKMLEVARRNGLKVSVHCAEIVDNQEVKDILEFHPERLGHGTCIHPNLGGVRNNWETLLKKKIPVELCLSSNIKCKTVESYDKHHFKLLYAAKHPLTLATDDKGVFGTSLSEEFEVAENQFELSEEELWTLSYNSINYIFANENEKEVLRTILNQWRIGNL